MGIFGRLDHNNAFDFLGVHCRQCDVCHEAIKGFIVDSSCPIGLDLYNRWKETAQELPAVEGEEPREFFYV